MISSSEMEMGSTGLLLTGLLSALILVALGADYDSDYYDTGYAGCKFYYASYNNYS